MTGKSHNRLKVESSPYLLQHADNPVHWWAWNDDALKAAKETGKPILLSVGYAACHWCHVMAHESFEDAETAAIMNRLFINIKVDREERPDLDAIYQRALGLMDAQGGWPLTMFLSPDGKPFWGGTYFPKVPQFGRADFKTVLNQVAKVYSENDEALQKNQAALMAGLSKIAQSRDPEDMTKEIFWSAVELLLSYMDPVSGGTQWAPKFPNVPLLELLWRAYIRSGDASYKDAVVTTLTHICQGGIYDHLGGGFCRYATDAQWLAPHFEKMLYDNALLVGILTEVWKETRLPLFETRVRETINWLKREMLTTGGAFTASLDADTEGEEGKFYVWRNEEVDEVLGRDSKTFKEFYGVRVSGNWEGVSILNRLHAVKDFNPVLEKKITPLRKRLMAARSKRERPFLDDKILADWNGLMITALGCAGQAFDEASWIALAEKAYGFIATTMSPKGRLHHSWRAEKLGPGAFLDDYAAMIEASTVLFQLSGDVKYLSNAKKMVSEVENSMSGPDFDGFFMVSGEKPDLVATPRTFFDQATPAGNAVMIGNYVALSRLGENQKYLEKANKLLCIMAGEARNTPIACTSTFSAFDAATAGAHLYIKGAHNNKTVQAMLKVAAGVSFPGLTIQADGGGKAKLGAVAVALKKNTAIICRGMVCSLPIHKPAILKQELLKLRRTKV